MGSSSSPGARRRRGAIIADAVAGTQEGIASAPARPLDDVRGAPVPDWAVPRRGQPLAWRRYPAIVKPAAEDASLGIDDRSVVRDGAELEAARARVHESWERVLVQRFIEGRELNLALVGDCVLPHAEIEWALPDGLPH